jgi:thioredoxin-like negative regulator of GroEL
LDGSITLSCAQAGDLRAALKQMDLLLLMKDEDRALPHLLSMLRRLMSLRDGAANRVKLD